MVMHKTVLTDRYRARSYIMRKRRMEHHLTSATIWYYWGRGKILQSYNTCVVWVLPYGQVVLSKDWGCSRTTKMQVKDFLGTTIEEIRARIEDGTYRLVNYISLSD